MTRAALTCRLRAWVATAPEGSFTWIVKDVEPGAPGVPLKTPLLVSVSPAGSDPAETENVGKPSPPTAFSAWLYGAPCMAAGSVVVVMVSPASTRRENDCDVLL